MAAPRAPAARHVNAMLLFRALLKERLAQAEQRVDDPCLDAVADGVADQVQHGAEERVDDGLVQADGLAFGLDAHVLALAVGGVARGQPEAGEERLQGHHERRGDLALLPHRLLQSSNV